MSVKLDLSPEWFAEAACAGKGNAQFFGENASPETCRDCTVRVECLEWALAGPPGSYFHGIYGGTYGHERHDRQKALDLAARGRPEWRGELPKAAHGGRVMWTRGCRCGPCEDGHQTRLAGQAQRVRVRAYRLRSVS